MPRPAPPIESGTDAAGTLSPWLSVAQRTRLHERYLSEKGHSVPGALERPQQSHEHSTYAALHGLGLDKFISEPPRLARRPRRRVIPTDCGEDYAVESIVRGSSARDLTSVVRRDKLTASGTVERNSPYWERRIDPYKGVSSSLGAAVAPVLDDPALMACSQIADPGRAARGPQRATEPAAFDSMMRRWVAHHVERRGGGMGRHVITDRDKEYLDSKCALWMQRTEEPMDPPALDKLPSDSMLDAVHYYASSYYLDNGVLSNPELSSAALSPAESDALGAQIEKLNKGKAGVRPLMQLRSAEHALGIANNMRAAFDDTAAVALGIYLEEYANAQVRNIRHDGDNLSLKRLRRAVAEEEPRKRTSRRIDKAALGSALAERLRKDAPNSSDGITVTNSIKRVTAVPRARQYFASRSIQQ